MKFTADNTDINESLLDGKDTFHTTQVPGWQRGQDKTKHLASLRPADRSTLVIPEALCSNIAGGQFLEDKSVPVFAEPIEQNWYTLFTPFLLASGIRSRNQCFRTQRREAGCKLKIYRSLPLWPSIQSRRLRWLGFRLSATGCATLLFKCRKSHFVCTG